MTTALSHIDARKHLVQEAVAKGSASAEVLDAAFKDAALATGTPGSSQRGDFTLGRLLVTPPAGVPVQEPAVPQPTAGNGDGSGATVVGKPPFDLDTNVDAPALDADGGETVFQPPLQRWQTVIADPQKRRIVAGGGGAVLLVLLVAIAKCGGGATDKDARDPKDERDPKDARDPKATDPKPGDKPRPATPAPKPPKTVPKPGAAIDPPPTPGSGDDKIKLNAVAMS